jgi:hypothetical protein
LWKFKVVHPHGRSICADIFFRILSDKRFAKEELELQSRDGGKISLRATYATGSRLEGLTRSGASAEM